MAMTGCGGQHRADEQNHGQAQTVIASGHWPSVGVPYTTMAFPALRFITCCLAFVHTAHGQAIKLDGPNLVLITVQGLRADHVGRTHIQAKSLTPNLDAMTAKGLSFSKAFAPSNDTVFSTAAMLRGAPPSSIDTLDGLSFRYSETPESLSAILSARHYRSLAVFSGPRVGPDYIFDEGFERTVAPKVSVGVREVLPTFLGELDGLKNGDSPFFAWIDLSDCTDPMLLPPSLMRLNTPGYQGPLLEAMGPSNPVNIYEQIHDNRWFGDFKPTKTLSMDGAMVIDPNPAEKIAGGRTGLALSQKDLGFLRGTYATGVAVTDMAIGAIIDRLGGRHRLENTLVVVVGSSGAALGEDGHFLTRTALNDTTTHVPAIFYGYGVDPKQVTAPTAMTQIKDITLALLSQNPMPASTGKPFAEQGPGQVFVRDVNGWEIQP